MEDIIYLVYDGGEMIAGFTMLVTTVGFIEDYRPNSPVAMSMVDAKTGEVVDIWQDGAWESGKEW